MSGTIPTDEELENPVPKGMVFFCVSFFIA